MKIQRTTAVLALFVATALLTIGCGSGAPKDMPELGTVSGVVTLDGAPLANVNVLFTPEKGRPSSATTDESGNYELKYSNEHQGAKVGKHTVRITTAPKEGEGEPTGEIPTPEQQAAEKESIPAKYNSKTELKEEVKAGSNTINFDLKK